MGGSFHTRPLTRRIVRCLGLALSEVGHLCLLLFMQVQPRLHMVEKFSGRRSARAAAGGQMTVEGAVYSNQGTYTREVLLEHLCDKAHAKCI